MSKGRYVIEGAASPWLMLPHSEAWYSADTCEAGEASDIGHPDNPLGTGQMAIDAVAALAEARPDFPWADYDVEDQGDRDGDGNLFEPDGALDHVIVLHAGKDQAAAAGPRARTPSGRPARWSARRPAAWSCRAADGLRVFNYTTQPENAGIGVIAHEYGHDLGLPDLYDVDRARHRHRRRLVGPDVHRLAQRPAVPGAAHPHGGVEQVRARLDRARGAGVRQQARLLDARPGLPAAEGHRGGGQDQPAGQAGAGRRAAQRRAGLVELQRPELRRRTADPQHRGAHGR